MDTRCDKWRDDIKEERRERRVMWMVAALLGVLALLFIPR